MQDIRIGRTTCGNCGAHNPPWGHVNSFDERRLAELLPGLEISSRSFVGLNRAATVALAVLLMDLAGNPWGTYDQEERCLRCGSELAPPATRSLLSRVCSGLAFRLNQAAFLLARPRPTWIHLVFSKTGK